MVGEPSLEDILASIKKVIAEDGQGTRAPRRRSPAAAEVPKPTRPSPKEDVLELSDMLDDDDALIVSADDEIDDDTPMVSEDKSRSMRESLEALATMSEPRAAPQIVRSGETSLESMVREMLRPMLAQWLDEHLPDMVEALVAKEIGRITGKRG